MAPALNVCFAVRALAVADREVDDFEVQASGAEDEVEVAKGVEIAEVRAVGGDAIIVGPAQDFGAAESVLDALAEQPGENNAEEF